jgi:hypothetical protein
MASTDSDGNRLHSAGTWNSGTNLDVQGGQIMHFAISNLNALGTTIDILSNLGGHHNSVILPGGTVDLAFSCFGNEPMAWNFAVSTNSDAFLVSWNLYSSWVPGDPPNP